MSFSQAQLDALDGMIASGVLETEFDGKRLRYRSMADLREARRMVAEGLASAAGTRRETYVNPTFDRGV